MQKNKQQLFLLSYSYKRIRVLETSLVWPLWPILVGTLNLENINHGAKISALGIKHLGHSNNFAPATVSRWREIV